MKHIAFLVMACSFLLSLVAGSAFAEEKAIPGSSQDIEVGAGWTVAAEDADSFELHHSDGLVVFVGYLTADDAAAAIASVDEALAGVEGLTFAEPVAEEVEGHKALSVVGAGKAAGTDVVVGVAIVEADDTHVVLLAGFGTADAVKAHEADLDAIAASIFDE